MFILAIIFLIVGMAAVVSVGYVVGTKEESGVVIVLVIALAICITFSSYMFLETGKENQKDTVLRYLVSQDKVELKIDTEYDDYIYILKDSSLVELFNHLMEDK